MKSDNPVIKNQECEEGIIFREDGTSGFWDQAVICWSALIKYSNQGIRFTLGFQSYNLL